MSAFENWTPNKGEKNNFSIPYRHILDHPIWPADFLKV